MANTLKNKTSFYLLRGALLKKGYKNKANSIVSETIVHLKATKVTHKRSKFFLDLAIKSLIPMFELKTKKVAAQKLKIPAYLSEKRATLMRSVG